MRYSLYVFLLLTLVACKTAPDDKNYSAEEFYAQAMQSMEDHHFEQAIKKFEKLQSRYPYGKFAQQAQMEIAYAYYKQGEPAPALSGIERFIKQYPNNPNLDYVYYLKGLINFDENLGGTMNRLSRQDPSERDPKSMRDSFDAFKEMVTRYPNSRYAPDAILRMQYLINTLAASDVHVANYYLRRGAYVAAANRAKGILLDYPQSSQSREALKILVQAYGALGLNDLRDDAQRVLNLNLAQKELSSDTSLALPVLTAASAVPPGGRL